MSDRIHIALLADCLENFAGGAEKQIYELARGLDKSRFRVTVISLETQGQASREAIEGIGCGFAVFKVKRIYGLSGLVQGWRFFSYLKQNRVDILQTYHFSSDIWGTFWAHLAGIKFIVSNRRDMGFWRRDIHIWAYRLINPWVTKIVAVAGSVKEMVMETEKVSASRIEVIYNGIELKLQGISPDRLESIRRELNIAPDDKIIAHVANLKPVKGHACLLQAMAGVVREFPNVKLLLIGKDEMGGRLQQMAQDLKIADRVIFLGRRDDVPALLALSYMCVLPSLSEGMSNAILEYMLAGKAVVATRVGGNSELVSHGTNGLLVEKEDSERLRDALIQLLKSPTETERMGETGFRRIENEFLMDGMVRRYAEFFDALMRPKLKVLHFISSGGLYGAENVLLSLAQQMGRSETIVPVVGALLDRRDPHLEVVERAAAMGVQTAVFESQGRVDIRSVLALAKYIKENNISLLHTHNYKSDLVGFLAARKAGIPVIATAHGFTDVSRAVTCYERIDRFILGFFNKAVVVTDKLLPHLGPARRTVIPNGLDLEKFSATEFEGREFRRRYAVPDDAFVIGTVGRLSREKNQRMLLESAVWLKDLAHVKFVIVGEGPEEKALRNFVKEKDMEDKVIFTGLLSDTSKAYPAFDIFTLTSLTEGVPLTVLEAMAAGKPVVATRVGGIPGIVQDRTTGFLVDSGDTEGLVAGFQFLLENPQERERFGRQALQFVRRNFALEQMTQKYLDIYREVMGR